jgi:hypothetical protein
VMAKGFGRIPILKPLRRIETGAARTGQQFELTL